MEPERPEHHDPKTTRTTNERTIPKDACPQDHVPRYEQCRSNQLLESENEVAQNKE